MDTKYYTLKEVGQILRVSVSTVRRAIKATDLKAVRVGSQGQLRIAQSELDHYVALHSDSPAATVPRRSNGKASIVQSNIIRPANDTGLRISEGSTPSGASWKLINADVLEGLKLLDNDSVNCIITSPPYYWQRDYELNGQIGLEDTIDAYVECLVKAFGEVRRVIAPDGVLFLNLGDTYYSAKGRPHGQDKKHNGRQMARRRLRAVDGPGLGLPRKSLIGIPWRVALAMQADGWTLRSAVIWQRPGSLPEPTAKDRPWRTYEHVFIFSRDPRYWFNREGLNGEEDIWQIVSRPENTGSHFAPYPRDLVVRCLDCGCPPGGTVLDPFVGSGTTMLTALHQGLSAIGIDLKPEYFDFVKRRLNAEFQPAVSGAAPKLFDEVARS